MITLWSVNPNFVLGKGQNLTFLSSKVEVLRSTKSKHVSNNLTAMFRKCYIGDGDLSVCGFNIYFFAIKLQSTQFQQFCGFCVFLWLIKPGSLVSHHVTWPPIIHAIQNSIFRVLKIFRLWLFPSITKIICDH